MKKFFITIGIILTALALNLSAQSLSSYKAKLSHPGAGGARVEVKEVGAAKRLLDAAPSGDIQQTVNAYRVEIFSDNTSQARRLAYEAFAKFKELYPEIPADDLKDIRYDSPKYTVRIGYFLTQEEAIIMCGRLKNHFKAYPRIEKLPLSVFAEKRQAAAQTPATEQASQE